MRYIAINDGVDTSREDNEFTPLRNWFNEFYARDTSKKIRAVKQAKAQKGERVNGECPYGYIIDPTDKNKLIIDPETVSNVQKIFELYTKGLRMCEIQKWLLKNEVITAGALRFQRTGLARYQRGAAVPYTWSDKTIYDILSRQEYLGHTVTNKTQKVSYKSKKTKKIPVENRYFFPNTHEAIIDETTFELAQKRLSTRNRPNTSDEIDIFSGLLFCADCGYKMGLQRGAGTLPRKHAYMCGAYRNRARTGSVCTTHYIRKSVILDIVLADLRRVLVYVKQHEQDFIATVNEHNQAETRQSLTQNRNEFEKSKIKLNELDTVFRKLYSDNALGRLSDEQFLTLTAGYDNEKAALSRRLDELENSINSNTDRKNDIAKFVRLVGKYSDIQELDYEVLHEFIDSILIHDLDREAKTRKIEIFYSFVGRVNSGDKPVEDVSRIRREMIDVKTFAI